MNYSTNKLICTYEYEQTQLRTNCHVCIYIYTHTLNNLKYYFRLFSLIKLYKNRILNSFLKRRTTVRRVGVFGCDALHEQLVLEGAQRVAVERVRPGYLSEFGRPLVEKVARFEN